MSNMFGSMYGSFSYFNQALDAWNIGQVTFMYDMFGSIYGGYTAPALSDSNKLAIHASFEAQVPSLWDYPWDPVRISLDRDLKEWCSNQTAAEATRESL